MVAISKFNYFYILNKAEYKRPAMAMWTKTSKIAPVIIKKRELTINSFHQESNKNFVNLASRLYSRSLNCKYHPGGLSNDMQMSIYNRKH